MGTDGEKEVQMGNRKVHFKGTNTKRGDYGGKMSGRMKGSTERYFWKNKKREER